MDHFLYRDGILHAEDVPLPQIAAEVGTPFYVYSCATLTRHYQLFEEALSGLDHLVCFAVKSNSNQAVLAHLAGLGAGMDVVSGGEYLRAKAAGVPGERIVFSGVGKTADEMRLALEGGIRQFNVESEPELETLSAVATSLGRVAPITIRVNPDVDARTHEKIATGKSENKFGIPIAHAREVYARAAALPGIEVIGIDVHIGSQLTELEPFEIAYTKVAELTRALRADGHDIRRLDLGGGLGIPYERSNTAPPLPARLWRRHSPHRGRSGRGGRDRARAAHLGQRRSARRGRDLRQEGRRARFPDPRCGDERPCSPGHVRRLARYRARHRAPCPASNRPPYDIVGPVCETGDTFAKQRPMPPVAAGDLVAFRSAGAYGAVMASEYNTRPLIPEISGERGSIRRHPGAAIV